MSAGRTIATVFCGVVLLVVIGLGVQWYQHRMDCQGHLTAYNDAVARVNQDNSGILHSIGSYIGGQTQIDYQQARVEAQYLNDNCGSSIQIQ